MKEFLKVFVVIVTLATNAMGNFEIDLSGTWRFKLDPANDGIGEQWFLRALPDTIQLPGSLQSQGYGDKPSLTTLWRGGTKGSKSDPRYGAFRKSDNFKIPFWLQPDRHYIGAAWYQRDIDIPGDWVGQSLQLILERALWETRVWLDGRELIGSDRLGTPHRHDFVAESAGKHVLTIRVDNRMVVDVGVNAHSVSDHTQSAWNGLIGDLRLIRRNSIWFDDVQVYPDPKGKRVRIEITLFNRSGKEGKGKLHLLATPCNTKDARAPLTMETAVEWAAGEKTMLSVKLPMGEDVLLWDEFSPNLYRLELTMTGDASARREETFGMVHAGTQGTRITVNGRPVFLRGTLECAIFPLTGYPPMEGEPWKRIFRICKEHGLNHLRFHSWCPPKAAFKAADEMGVYLQVEASAWTTVGEDKPVDAWLYEEGRAMIREYGNHPSFIMMAYGNEPSGPKRGAVYLSKWVAYWRAADPRRLHTGAAGWPAISENDYHNVPGPRIQSWGGGLGSIINSDPPRSDYDWSRYVRNTPQHPLVSHEIGQWCAFPNLDEIRKYTGFLKAKNFEIFREFLDQKGMGHQARLFLMASGKLQAQCYKADIEAALRTEGFGGFQLLDLHDFPGQGTALVGVLDSFWEGKGYITADEYRRFAGQTVPLALLPKHVFTSDEMLIAPVRIAHHGVSDISQKKVVWSLVDERKRKVAEGIFEVATICPGGLTTVGEIRASLTSLSQPACLTLVVGIDGTEFHNDWSVYVYPRVNLHTPSSKVLVTDRFDETARERLHAGGKVWLQLKPATVKTDVKSGFSSIFWNTAWSCGQAPHTMGILCDPHHPAFSSFPTTFHSDWQWWFLITTAATMELDRINWPGDPLVQMVPDWFAPKKLALAFEAKFGAGKLLVTSIDMKNPKVPNPVSIQFHNSLLDYIESNGFSPKDEITFENICKLVEVK